jgi:protein TonB
MGKILKYCSSCEEGFAERFTFCPDCGGSLQAVQLNPVEPAAAEAEPAAPDFIAASEEVNGVVEPEVFDEAPVYETEPAFEPAMAYEADAAATTGASAISEGNVVEFPDRGIDVEESVVAETPGNGNGNGAIYTSPAIFADEPRAASSDLTYERADDGGFYVTVIQDKDTKTRNALLLGATGLVLFTAVIVTLVSLFQKDMGVGAVDDSPLFSAVLVDDVPMPVEDKEPEKAADDDDGGGGGGGKNEKTPASRGDLPDMTPKPSRPPDVNTPRLENPSLPIPPPQIQGPPMRTPKEYGRWGVPNGLDGPPSNGPGTGGGIGSGTGTGVGSGTGTGAGSGTGSGLGSGVGNGIGGGRGTGGAPPEIRAAVTENFRIISKPKPPYTDAARTNQVQGRVLLKVTLLASGQVGSITPVQRLPHGLTESAIAAARQIKFTPKKVNGVAQTVIVTLDYGFNMY